MAEKFKISNLDFPQPLGPINAVISFDAIDILIFFSA